MTRVFRPVPWDAARRSAPLVLTALSLTLIGAFIWWRVTAQYARAEAFWAPPLAASADAFRARAAGWLTARRDAGEIMDALLADDGGRTPAFDAAAGDLLRRNGVRFLTLRIGAHAERCSLVASAIRCVPGSSRYAVPSVDHPQARRVRPSGDGRLLVPVATRVARPRASGTLTQWIDPEVALIPDVMRTPGSIRDATTTFFRVAGDSALIIRASPARLPRDRRTIPIEEMPTLFAGDAIDGELARGYDAAGVDALGVAAYVPRLRWFVARSIPREAALGALRSEVTTDALLAFLLGSFIIGLFALGHRSRREQEARAAVVQARLDSLNAQLRPHFLFNALNTIATLVHEDVALADRMLLRLADLLRLSLEESDHALLPLEREYALLTAFLEVERVRFGPALRVASRFGRGTRDALVPRWLLQPLVENAIKHGAAYARGELAVSIDAICDRNRLCIIVSDDGPRAPDSDAREGVGLRMTRERLASLFGEEASIVLRPCDTRGTAVVIEMPARYGADDHPPVARTAAAPFEPLADGATR